MKQKVKTFAAILTSGVSLWVAAPALSTAPFIPEAEDFTQALPSIERIDGIHARGAETADEHGEIRFITPEIEAPKRFDLVGYTTDGEPAEIELRTSEDGSEWSDWVHPEGGDPVWAGGADWVQIRSHEKIPAGELFYVNVSGDGDPLSGALNDVRGAVNGAFIAATATLGVESAQAARAGVASKPRIIKRQAWGAENRPGGCNPRSEPTYGKVKAAAIHHTVSTNGYSEQQAAGLVLGICRYHVKGNGWDDIGYNFLVDAYGNVYEGRAGGIRKAVQGAHAQGYNGQTTGVSVIGNHSEDEATPQTMRALKKLLSWKLSHHGKKARGRGILTSGGGSVNRYDEGERIRFKRIFAHTDANFTECAGAALISQLPDLRKKAQRRIDRYAVEAPAEDPQGEPSGKSGKSGKSSGGIGRAG